MSPACPSLEALQAAAAGRMARSPILNHIRGCSRCQETTEALAGLSPLLSELAQAERGDRAPDIWTGVVGRLERPRFIERLPLGVAGSARVAAEFARPSVATAVAMGLAGLSAGAWLGLTSQSPVDASANDPFVVSSLVDDPGDGLASTYSLSFASTEGSSEAASPTIPGSAEPLEQDSTLEKGSSSQGDSRPEGDSRLEKDSPTNTPGEEGAAESAAESAWDRSDDSTSSPGVLS